MAGRGGMGDGERPRPGNAAAESAGDPAACEPEKEDRREPGLVDGGGGFIAVDVGPGVDGTDALGIMGAPPGTGLDKLGRGISVCSDAEVITEPVSDVVDARRTMSGRDAEEGIDGVRECLTSIREARDIGWTSGTPLRNTNVLTWTDLMMGSARDHELVKGSIHRSDDCVAMYSFRGSHETPWTLCECSRSANTHSPVEYEISFNDELYLTAHLWKPSKSLRYCPWTPR